MLISEKLCSYARKTLLGETDEDNAEMKEDVLKKDSESQIKLITLYVLLN